MSADIKKVMSDDIHSKILELDIRAITLAKSFSTLESFLSKETNEEELKNSNIIYQYLDKNNKDISQAINTISDELGNVYPLIEHLMKNNKLFSLEVVEPEKQSLAQRIRNKIKGNEENKFTTIQNPMSISIDMIEEARTLPKIWETYLFHMRQRFVLEAVYWQDPYLQRKNLILERDYLFGIVKPRIQKLFSGARQAIEEKVLNMERTILAREMSDEQKMLAYQPQPAAGQSNNQPAK